MLGSLKYAISARHGIRDQPQQRVAGARLGGNGVFGGEGGHGALRWLHGFIADCQKVGVGTNQGGAFSVEVWVSGSIGGQHTNRGRTTRMQGAEDLFAAMAVLA